MTKDDGLALLCDGVSLGTRKQEDETRDIIIIIRKLRVILFAEFSLGHSGGCGCGGKVQVEL